jgi:Cu/Ag efflux protein CusF
MAMELHPELESIRSELISITNMLESIETSKLEASLFSLDSKKFIITHHPLKALNLFEQSQQFTMREFLKKLNGWLVDNNQVDLKTFDIVPNEQTMIAFLVPETKLSYLEFIRNLPSLIGEA